MVSLAWLIVPVAFGAALVADGLAVTPASVECLTPGAAADVRLTVGEQTYLVKVRCP